MLMYEVPIVAEIYMTSAFFFSSEFDNYWNIFYNIVTKITPKCSRNVSNRIFVKYYKNGHTFSETLTLEWFHIHY